MAMRIELQSHYLPADSIALIGKVLKHHPALASLAILLSFGAAVAILRRHFGRGGGDILVTAVFFVVVAAFSAACLYLLATHPGYRAFHPGF